MLSSSKPAFKQDRQTSVHDVLLAALPLAGLAISVYLWQSKRGATELICGGFSDCVSVNASAYSEIAGVPIAAAGALMYLALLVLGVVSWFVPKLEQAQPIAYLGFALALSGALFSLYLTGIEAFVLGAYCIWCLVSWVIITTLAFLWGRRGRTMSEVQVS